MGNIFCLKRKAAETTTQTREVLSQDLTILKLKAVRDKLLSQKKALYNNADKAKTEAKELIKQQKKERAIFALKRQKLYENMVQDMENQYTIIGQTILDVESKIQMAQFTDVLRDTNELIKELESTIKYEEIHKIGQEMKEREQDTREFNKLFEEHHVNNGEVDELFDQYEKEINGDMYSSQSSNKSRHSAAKQQLGASQKSSVKAKSPSQISEEGEDEESDSIGRQLLELA